MNRKHVFLLLVILLGLSCFSSCSHEQQEETPEVAEAETLADSLTDEDALVNLIHKYHKKRDAMAELVIRQKYGKVLRDKSVFDKAINQHDTCISMAQELNDTLQLIIAYNNQGTNYRRLGDMQAATDMHYAALTLCDKVKDNTSPLLQTHITRTFNGLGNVQLSLKNYDAAEALFRRAYNSEVASNNATGIAINLANLGSIKEKTGDIDSARIYYNKSLDYNISADNIVGMCLCYMYLGNLAEQGSNNKEAMEYYRKSYSIGVPTGDIWHWLEPCLAMGKLYLNEHKTDSASKYISLAMKNALDIHSFDHLARVYELNAELQEQLGNYGDAIKSIHISQAYNDTIAVSNSQNHMQNMRVNYESNKVKIAEEKAKSERRIRQFILAGAGIAIFLVGAIILIWARHMRERRKVIREKEKTAQERQEFYRAVTHQLRTPITVVIGMMEQLQKYVPNDNKIANDEFDAANRQCKQLLNLITEMIDYAKSDKAKPVKVSELNSDVSQERIEKIQRGIRSYNEQRQDNGNSFVLLAEDNPDVALLITEMLKNENYNFEWAKDGQEAWEMMKENLPDLLVTDIMIPRMDGLELIKNIREDESTNHIPIIVVSARVEDEDRLTGIEAGAEVYLGKPFIPNELLLRIQKLLEQRSILRNKFMARIEKDSKVAEAGSFTNREAATASKDTVAPNTQANEGVTPPHSQDADDNENKSGDTVGSSADAHVENAPVATDGNTTSESESEEDANNNFYSQHLTKREQEFMKNVDGLIRSNLTNSELSSAMLASLLNTTTSTLNRKLKNLTDIDTTHYIRMHRISRAKYLLENSDMPMVEIQMECGFETPSYFCRTFKAEVGVTPSEFRKIHE